jgi:hypothetical protein
MIVLLMILAFALLALVLGAQRLLRLGGRDTATLADLEILFDSGTERYAHIERVLGTEDFGFLAHSRCGSNLIRQLRARRTRTMALYLKQMAGEFDSLMAIGALFAAAPTAQAERFAQQLARRRLRFTLLFAGVWIKTYGNYLFRWPVEMGRLTEQIRTLRYDADRILHALTPADLGALRNVLQNS